MHVHRRQRETGIAEAEIEEVPLAFGVGFSMGGNSGFVLAATAADARRSSPSCLGGHSRL
jgi:hypothetical protein